MKTFAKKILAATAGLVLLLATMSAQAQHYARFSGLTDLVPGGTNWIVGNDAITTVSNYPPYTGYIQCPKSDNVLLYISFRMAGGTTNSAGTLWNFYRSPQPGLICSNSPITFTIFANASTSTNRFVTNIVMNGLPYLYMTAPGNSNLYAMTNLTVSYGFKN